MFERKMKKIFCILFLAMLYIPLFMTNRKKNVVSSDEKRMLAQMPGFYKEDGTKNTDFNIEFEAWINDNIGLRSFMVVANARLQYYVFDVLSNNSDMYLGPKGEFNYATAAMLADYRHVNLYSQDQLLQIADSFQTVNDFLEQKGMLFWYYQCWDKHSIYPEYFPTTVIQNKGESKTDGIVRTIQEHTTVSVISPKQELIDAKIKLPTYSKWGDAAHWTQRGAYIGYLKLMAEINAQSDNRYKVLGEDDYNITITDQGSVLFGGIHNEDMQENFEIRNPQAVLTNEKLTLYGEDQRHRFYTNESVKNDTRLLLIGDSYFEQFIIEDMAESFHETVLIWGDYCADIEAIIEAYEPDLVVLEAAERVDRTSGIIRAAETLRN